MLSRSSVSSKNVFLVGMEEGIFPGSQTLYGGPEEMEEERRLAYVAITRAKKKLFITNASTRMLYGSTTRNFPSRFLNEIPREYCSEKARINPGYASSTVNNPIRIRPSGNSGVNFGFTPAPKPRTVSADNSQYKTGQVVIHSTFGQGMIIKVTKMSNDILLEIAFDDVGTKKIMANYAKLTIKD